MTASNAPAQPAPAAPALSDESAPSRSAWPSRATAWFVGGLYLDAWVHDTIASLETFFTSWHRVLYAGFWSTAVGAPTSPRAAACPTGPMNT
jgi:hypothetical protein